MKILLAEDNPVNQKVAQLMLRRIGYELDIAGDGQKAIDMIKETPYDLILMDVHMPIMDGLEAARWIRENIDDDKQPKIIVMTATMMAEAKVAWKGIEVNGFIEKPVRVELLENAIKQAVGE